MTIGYALYTQQLNDSLPTYVASINTALTALGPIGVQDVLVTRLEDGPGKRGRLRITLSYSAPGTVLVGAAYFSSVLPTDPGDVDAQAATFFATNPLYRALVIRDIGNEHRGGLDANAILVLYATTPLSNCGQDRARPMIVQALAGIAAGATGPVQMVSANGLIAGATLMAVNRFDTTWAVGTRGYAMPRAGTCIVDGYKTCCNGGGGGGGGA